MHMVRGAGGLDRLTDHGDNRGSSGDRRWTAALRGIEHEVFGEQIAPGIPLLGIEQAAIARLDLADRVPVAQRFSGHGAGSDAGRISWLRRWPPPCRCKIGAPSCRLNPACAPER